MPERHSDSCQRVTHRQNAETKRKNVWPKWTKWTGNEILHIVFFLFWGILGPTWTILRLFEQIWVIVCNCMIFLGHQVLLVILGIFCHLHTNLIEFNFGHCRGIQDIWGHFCSSVGIFGHLEALGSFWSTYHISTTPPLDYDP